MSTLLQEICNLVDAGDIRISDHGYDEMAEDGIMARDVISGLPDAVSVEEYPDYPKGPCVLVLEKDAAGRPLHVVWGIPKGAQAPAVIVTAYRPDPDIWTNDYLRRRK